MVTQENLHKGSLWTYGAIQVTQENLHKGSLWTYCAIQVTQREPSQRLSLDVWCYTGNPERTFTKALSGMYGTSPGNPGEPSQRLSLDVWCYTGNPERTFTKALSGRMVTQENLHKGSLWTYCAIQVTQREPSQRLSLDVWCYTGNPERTFTKALSGMYGTSPGNPGEPSQRLSLDV